jgi:short-subunit dehydrogenase
MFRESYRVTLKTSEMSQKVILITGATDGIGLSLTQMYKTRGDRLVLLGRKPLSELASSLFTAENYCRVDLMHKNFVARVLEFLRTNEINFIDLVIHNAAVGYWGSIESQTPHSIREVMAINLEAPISLTHVLLPRLYKRNGCIAFISSVTSILATPDYAVYSASKAALDAFAKNLRSELTCNVTIKIVHPGATRTKMHSKSGMPANKFDTSQFRSPEETAKDVFCKIEFEKQGGVVGLSNRILRFANYHAGPMLDRLTYRVSA